MIPEGDLYNGIYKGFQLLVKNKKTLNFINFVHQMICYPGCVINNVIKNVIAASYSIIRNINRFL